MFRFDKWSVDQQANGLYALYESTPFSNHQVCKSFHYSLCSAVTAITRCALSEKASPDDLWPLWDSMGEIYEHADHYVQT